MKSAYLSRRWILKIASMTPLGLLFFNQSADAEEPPQRKPLNIPAGKAKTFLLHLVSLVPHAPLEKKSAIVCADIDRSVDMSTHLGLPISVQVSRDGIHSSDVAEFYSVSVTDSKGHLLQTMTIGTDSSATFVDHRIQVNLQVQS